MSNHARACGTVCQRPACRGLAGSKRLCSWAKCHRETELPDSTKGRRTNDVTEGKVLLSLLYAYTTGLASRERLLGVGGHLTMGGAKWLAIGLPRWGVECRNGKRDNTNP
ncbi:MAG: hypothetical protein IH977_02400 [Nitrospinae bacterium]|nr:hypothetical protein [Nitrospinota bacterium]